MPTARKRARAAPHTRSRSPQARRRGADADKSGGEPCVCRTARTRLGTIQLCATPLGVSRLKFVRDADADAAHADKDDEPASASPLAAQADAWLAQVAAFLNADDAPLSQQQQPQPRFDFPLDLRAGTPFQRSVWAAMRDVPCGDTTTYGDLARRLGSSPRAVGQAVGANPVGVVLPCHRVVAAAGKLGGFAWGTELKRALLRHEGVPLPAPV
jgi:O-6-methylguanine DNA methyltransferase